LPRLIEIYVDDIERVINICCAGLHKSISDSRTANRTSALYLISVLVPASLQAFPFLTLYSPLTAERRSEKIKERPLTILALEIANEDSAKAMFLLNPF